MINATRKVKEKAEPELREAVKRGRIGVQDAAKVADLPPEQQKAIAASPKPRRAANVAIEEAKNAAARSASGEEDPRAALRKAWEKATALRRLWKEADNGTREWFMEAVWFDLNKGDDRKRSAIEPSEEPGLGRRPARRVGQADSSRSRLPFCVSACVSPRAAARLKRPLHLSRPGR